MFTPGQIVFALLFILVFVVVMVRMYQRDLPWMRKQYKGTIWVLIAFIGFMALLLLLKYALR